MVLYFFRRILYAVVLLFIASVVAFIIIQLPPGDYLTTYINQLKASGQQVDQARIDNLKRQYGLDQPMYTQYWMWISGFPKGDFGFAFQQNRPVNELIGERLGYSVMISLLALVLLFVAIPIGLDSRRTSTRWAFISSILLDSIGLAFQDSSWPGDVYILFSSLG